MQALEAFGKGFAVAVGLLVDEDGQRAAEGVLHVGVGRAAGGVAGLPPHPGAAQQAVEHPGIDVAAVVEAHVHDQSFAVELRVEVAGKVGDVLGAHGAQVQVADAALAGAVHRFHAAGAPVLVAQCRFAAGFHRRHHAFHAPAIGFANAESNGFAGFALQQHAALGPSQCAAQFAAIDGGDHVALGKVHAGREQGSALADQFGLAPVELRNASAAFHRLQARAQARHHRGCFGQRWQVAGSHLAVEQAEVRAHLGHQFGQFLAVAHALQQGFVALAAGHPVHAVQLGVVEVVAAHAPGIGKELLPFFARVHRHLPVAPAHGGLGEVGRRLGGGVEQQDVWGCAGRGLALHQQGFAVAAERVAAHAFAVQLCRGVGFDGDGAQRRAGAHAIEEPNALGINGQVAVATRRNRQLVQALGQALRHDARQLGARRGDSRLGVGLGIGFGLGLGVFSLRLGRLGQFVFGREGRAKTRLQRQRVEPHAGLEGRAHVAVGPNRGAGLQGEVTARGEVQPLPVGAEGGVAAVVAVAAQGAGLVVGKGVQPELVAEGWLRHRAREGQGLPVGVPGQILDTATALGRDQRAGAGAAFGTKVGEVQRAAHVGVGQVAPVGRGAQGDAAQLPVGGDALGRRGAEGVQLPDLHLATEVAKGEHRLVVAAELRLAAARGGFALLQLRTPRGLGALRGQAAAHAQHQALAIGGHGEVGEEVLRAFDPARGHRTVVARQRDGQGRQRSGCGGVQVDAKQVGATRHHHAAAAERSVANVEVLPGAVRAGIPPVQPNGPQVDEAVAVAQEGDARLATGIAVGHGPLVVGARCALQQRPGFGLAVQVQHPELGDGPTPVGLGVVAAQALAGEVQLLAVCAQGEVGGVAHGQGFQLLALEAKRLGLRAAVQGGRCEQQVALRIGTPEAHLGAGQPGAALGGPAREGHGVHVAGAVDLRHKGQRLAVGQEHRPGFLPGMGREALGSTALRTAAPEVALAHKDQGIALQRGLAVEALRCRLREAGSEGGGQKAGKQGQARHGQFPEKTKPSIVVKGRPPATRHGSHNAAHGKH